VVRSRRFDKNAAGKKPVCGKTDFGTHTEDVTLTFAGWSALFRSVDTEPETTVTLQSSEIARLREMGQ
jgi:hypothetical protein